MTGMTPDEAAETWCPKSHGKIYDVTLGGRHHSTVTGNRSDDADHAPRNCFCFGSGCQWWEWDVEWSKPGKVLPARPRRLKTGYCGAKRAR